MSDREDLKTLKRAQLQQLAKKNGIPANLSSAAIIARVLEIRAGRSAAVELAPATEPQVEAAVVSPPRHEQIATHESAAPPPGDGSANLGSDERGTPDPSDAVGPASILAITTDPEAIARSLPSTPQTPYAASLAGSAQTFGTPESPASSPGTPPVPADPELIRETVAMMAAIDKMDHAYGERLARMRAATTKLQAEATELENRILSEHSRRERMQNYLVYWQNEPPRWSYEAVWSGQLKLKDLYECEEVDTEDDQDQESQLNGSPIPIQPGRTTRKRKYDPSHEDNDDDLTPAEADDEARYRPRPRVEGIDPETGMLVPASSPTQKFIDRAHAESSTIYPAVSSPQQPSGSLPSVPLEFPGKGKAKMTEAQVEELEDGGMAPSGTRPLLRVPLPSLTEEIEQDQVAAFLIQSRSAEHVDTPYPTFVPGPTPILSPGRITRSAKVRG